MCVQYILLLIPNAVRSDTIAIRVNLTFQLFAFYVAITCAYSKRFKLNAVNAMLSSSGQNSKDWHKPKSSSYSSNQGFSLASEPTAPGPMYSSSSDDDTNAPGTWLGPIACGLLAGYPVDASARAGHRQHPDAGDFRVARSRTHTGGFTSQVGTNSGGLLTHMLLYSVQPSQPLISLIDVRCCC